MAEEIGGVLPASMSFLYSSRATHQCLSGARCSLQRVSPQYLHLYEAGLPQIVHCVRAMLMYSEKMFCI